MTSKLDSAVPLVGVGREMTITTWNSAAEQLLGIPRSEAKGRPCYEVLRGRDVHDNIYCGPQCPIARARAAAQPIRPFELRMESRGKRLALRVLTVWCEHEHFYLLSTVDPPPEIARGDLAVPVASESELVPSARELEILRHIAAGRGTKEIAAHLYRSTHTVRNHVQRLLQKLGAHSRLEAVSIARARGLL